MISLNLRLLTGRYIATSESSRREHEWPPHPARIFSALVATWAEADETSAERAALEWLETQDPPLIYADDDDHVAVRTAVQHFVPVNDATILSKSEQTTLPAKLLEKQTQLQSLREQAKPNTKKLERAQASIDKILDVSAKVTKIGSGDSEVAKALSLFPEGRVRQERFWPSVTPVNPNIVFHWPEAAPTSDVLAALDGLAERLVRVGHSSSMVAAMFTQDEPRSGPVWTPGPEGKPLRWVKGGQLQDLETRFANHQASKPRTLPKVGVNYRGPNASLTTGKVAIVSDLGGEWFGFTFKKEDRLLRASACVAIAKAVRGALCAHAPDPVDPAVSGHASDGSPLRETHVAVVPLPFVGPQHATGQIKGIAVLIPNSLTETTRNAVLDAFTSWGTNSAPNQTTFPLNLRHRVGSAPGSNGLTLLSGAALATVEASTWSGPTRHWVTATPIALPRHPRSLSKGSPQTLAKNWAKAEQIVADTFSQAGLPTPTDVNLSRDPLLAGALPSVKFPALTQGGRPRQLLHARVTFDEPVTGPVIVGSGRYYGLGLMYPLRDLDSPEGQVATTPEATK